MTLLIVWTTALVFMPRLVFASTAEQTCGSGVVHLVRQGENLFRISLRYGTSMSAIASANGIVNINRIYAGQQLIIPCAASQPLVTPPVLPATPQYSSISAITLTPTGVQSFVPVASGGADCSRFRATSPLNGLARGSNTFYWDPAPGATSYRVNIYNLEMAGVLVASYETGGLLTHLQGDVGEAAVGRGFHFAWEVQALVSDLVVCSSPRIAMLRAAA
jgi:LysM repeat protein